MESGGVRIDLGGGHVVVTGGCSGIGFATARRLLAAGATVTLLDRNPEGEAVAAAIGAGFVALDVADEGAVEAAAAALERDGPAPTGLVTAAGVLQRTLPPEDLSWKEWDLVVRVHQRGTFACCRSFGGRMAARGGGAVVTIASVAGVLAGPLHAYGPSKAAVAHLARGLAVEWGRRGVRVNAVAPGFTETPALERGFETGTLGRDRLAESAALGRLVRAEEVADAILFLLSPMASAVTGQTLTVDAGYVAAAGWSAYGAD